MKTLAIVSSYNESCGNASYTEVLRKEFSKYFKVDILPLQLDLLLSNNPKIVKMGNLHIDEMAQKLKKYDYVNIQFEAGLYGSCRKNICKRVKKLIEASDNIILTMHRVDLADSLWSLKNVARIFSNRHILKNLNGIRGSVYFQGLYEEVVDVMKKHSKNHNANIIVHDFPPTFLNEQERTRERSSRERKEFIEKYNFYENDKIIGLFGFVNEYKGHETAIKALRFLPHQYKIIIFGSQHPMSINLYSPVDPYIRRLMNVIEGEEDNNNKSKKKESVDLTQRVVFAGNLNDSDFIDALYCCDYAVLPYMEVNQSGSGIASLVLETKIKSFYSNNKAFAELNKYFPDTFERFDIGNYIELADKIRNYKHDYSTQIDKCLETYNIENNIRFHINIFEGNI